MKPEQATLPGESKAAARNDGTIGMSVTLGRAAPADAPLTGIRVLDLSTVVSGPLCAQILGDLGADVIKVETMLGDTTRRLGPPFHGGLTGLYTQCNRNKRSIALDLKGEGGAEVFLRLAAGADVLIENWRPGVAERLGVGYDRLAEQNPKLIYVAISGFGPDGPYRDLPAYDSVIQGLAGFMHTQGDAEPALVRSIAADKVSALTATYAVLAALFARQRGDGRGQRIDVPMLDSYVAFTMPDVAATHTFQSHPPPPPAPNIHRTWHTQDGHVVIMVIEDHQYRALCQAIEREDLGSDPRYATIVDRIVRMEELYELLAGELSKWPTAVLVERARRFGAPLAPANRIEDMMVDPQVRHSEVCIDLEHPEAGTLRYFRNPVRFARSSVSLRSQPPRLGQQSDEVLAEAGYEGAEIAALRAKGVVR